MDNFTAISNEIGEILYAIQQNGADAFVQVLEYPTNQFTGFPSVTIVPADVRSELMTVVENYRTYAFEVAIFVSVANTGDMSAEFGVMRTLVETALDALESSIDLNGVADFLVPVPMRWEVRQTGTGDALIAPIHVQAQKLVSI